ncbi:TlpA family protein disulfide reductase [Lacisediminimonas profundi]|uniref:TlpA family protein disulfide reductase n=1 Tax=Lacisediminimonas profundi TaxID=2603856 RepID=UPI00124BAE47|nr:TlpA disulfide reductase family protein [Lacisediminimonas profundi]
MSSITVGPLAIPVAPLILAGALLVGTLVARRIGGERAAEMESLSWRVLLFGLLAARAAYVAAWFESYAASPWKMLDIRDGGFAASAGIGAAAAMTAWLAWRRRERRKPLLAGFAAGAAFWMAGTVASSLAFAPAMQMPALVLETLDGKQLALQSLSGKPMVVNLWATWCPPCQREMPVLRDAQARHKDIAFVFVNQGESSEAVSRYLAGKGLVLDNVLLDSRGQLGSATGSRALPTTLFFDARGKLVDRRMGEVSEATLLQRVSALRATVK